MNNNDNICAVKSCGQPLHHAVHCPHFWGKLICMRHCLTCRYHDKETISGWCTRPKRTDKPPEEKEVIK